MFFYPQRGAWQIANEISDNLRMNIPQADLSPGTTLRFVVEAIAAQLEKIETQVQCALQMSQTDLDIAHQKHLEQYHLPKPISNEPSKEPFEGPPEPKRPPGYWKV